MEINTAFQLTYCTNIHPGANWERTFSSIKEHVPKIKEEVSPNASFGLGLRLSNRASEELSEGDNFPALKEWLQQHDVYVFTMNGFPYGNFHDQQVKDKVHTPDWTTLERLQYTKRLFLQLAQLLPVGMSGGISTSPISYRHWYASPEQEQKALEIGARYLADIVSYLMDIEDATGKYLHLDIEPEPDGLIENSDDVLSFFQEYLLPIATEILTKERAVPNEKAQDLIKRYITICYDICHFSLAYEEPEYTFKKFKEAGITIGKIQVSSALKIIYSSEDATEIWNTLSRFDEPTYLHQVTELVEGKVRTYNDIPMVLEQRKDFTELRAHFHVPIFLEKFGKLYATQDHILKVLDHLKKKPITEHLEIETYTWDVLPKELKKDVSGSIIREINWLKERI